MTEKLSLSWQDIQHLVQDIARQIYASNWRPDLIIGIDRGGLVPSVMLSHYLGVPHESVKVSLRDNVSTESVLWAPEYALEGKNILLVDDINDTGATQTWIRKDWADSVAGVDPCFDENFWHDEIRWASLVDNESSKEHSDFVGMTINKMEHDVWIDFPWESWWNRSTQ